MARRAVGVYERIIRRFTKQDTDYAQLLSTFAEGLYTEMDFRCVHGPDRQLSATACCAVQLTCSYPFGGLQH